MNTFLRTIVFGLAAMCIMLLAAGVTALLMLRRAEVVTPERIRDLLLKPDEVAYLAQMKARTEEPATVPIQAGVDEEKLLTDLAEIAGARHANALVEELRRRKDSLDEREREIAAREAAQRASRTDLARLATQIDGRRTGIIEAERTAALERTRWAEGLAAEANRLNLQTEVENARYAELAKLYALQKNDAWVTLRKLEPKEIARILNAMSLDDPKKTAQLLKLAQQDPDNPNMAVALHRELMTINPKLTGDEQVKRLAMLYHFMISKPDQILPYFKGQDASEIARILSAMPDDKDRAALLLALSKDDEHRGKQVADLLQPASVKP